MNILITGTTRGIGRATALLFLSRGYNVTGIDILPSSIDNARYTHYIADIADKTKLPEIGEMDIIINNAGVQNSGKDIDINLKGTIYVTEKYAFHKGIQSVLMTASASAHSGAEFPEYSASKGGVISYMRNVALRLAPYGATCNSISAGGVMTELNKPVMEDPKLWQEIMDVTPLKRWASPEEIAQWIYFLTIENKFCTGQDIVIDGGEKDLNSHFVWTK